MIVKMRHLTVLCTESSKKEALDALQSLGVMHVAPGTAAAGATPDLASAEKALSNAEKALGILAEVADGANGGVAAASPEDVVAAAAKIAELESSLAAKRSEIAAYVPFGDFNPADASELTRRGISIRLFTSATGELPAARPGGSVKMLGKGAGKSIYGVAFGDVDLGAAEEVALPAKSLAEMIRESEATKGALAAARDKLSGFRGSLEKLREALAERKVVRDFLAAEASMGAESGVAWLTGFCPVEALDKVRDAAEAHGWGIASREPAADELPPTLLRPPRIFKPITTLFEMLGITPSYYEADVSVVFYAFFTIFFAMLIGDAGYGAVILALTIFCRRKFRKAPSAPFILLGVFSGATIAWGILTATYFGIPQESLPAFLRFKTAAWFGDQSNIMQLCFFLGALHLTIARLWSARDLWPDTKALAEVGWAGVVWTMYCVSCLVVVDGFVFPKFMWGVAAVSALLIYLFMLKKEELKTEGVNLALLPLNIVSCLGDIISYVRLFAVGLASVKVAENFNSMATGLELPLAVKIPVMLLILAVGHGLNFAMGALSILVHAVRLNTLEFSNHKGISWSGFAYEPFRK